jgi:hypothetical protein
MCGLYNGVSSALYLNSSSTPAASGNANPNALTQLYIGGDTAPLNGKVAEIVVLNRLASLQDRQAFTFYAGLRYGLAVT